MLTILVPGIRTANWLRLYNSMFKACKKHDWEMVFISPYDLPDELKGKDNIQHIYSWATPIICQQQGLLVAKGEWINWAADDGVFLEDSQDVAFSLIKEISGRSGELNYKVVVMGKYLEGDGDTAHMKGNDYYILGNHDASRLNEIPKHYYMLNVGLVSKKLLLKVGGWDVYFEVCPMAYNDLAVRLQNYGVTWIVQNELMFTCSHTPGLQGDHGPIHNAQVGHDQPLFTKIYNPRSPSPVKRINVQLDKYLSMPKRWERRFGKAE